MSQRLGGEHTLGTSGTAKTETGWPIWGDRLMDDPLDLLVRIPMEVRIPMGSSLSCNYCIYNLLIINGCFLFVGFLIHLGNGYMEMDSHSTKVMGM